MFLEALTLKLASFVTASEIKIVYINKNASHLHSTNLQHPWHVKIKPKKKILHWAKWPPQHKIRWLTNFACVQATTSISPQHSGHNSRFIPTSVEILQLKLYRRVHLWPYRYGVGPSSYMVNQSSGLTWANHCHVSRTIRQAQQVLLAVQSSVSH